jgi:hypothetical protein
MTIDLHPLLVVCLALIWAAKNWPRRPPSWPDTD